MSCTRCAAPLDDADTACPSCGAERDTNAETGAAGERVWTTAGNLVNAARAAEGRLRDPELAGRLPGGSLAAIGYAGLLFAVLLDMSPVKHSGRLVSFGWDLSKLGHFWDVALLVLGAAALASRLLPQLGRDVPKPLTHPALPAGVAALAAGQAYLLLDVSLIPLLLLAAAAILVYDALTTGLAAAGARAFERAAASLPSPTAIGAALVAAAILLSWLPGRHSFLGGVVVLGSDPTGTLWGLLMLAASAATAALAIAPDTIPLDERYARWVLGGYALTAAAWAVVLFNLSLVPLLWLAGASVVAYDQYAKARDRTGGALSLRRLTVGPRLLVLAGVPVSILAMSFTWADVSSRGYFLGGYESSYSSYYGGYVSDYSFTKYYMPGFSASNTGFALGPSRFSFSPLVVAALLALVVLALWVSRRPVPRWAYVVPAGIVAVVGLWGVAHLNLDHLGPWVFLGGLALIGVAAVSVALPAVREYAADRAAAPATSPAPPAGPGAPA
jgi:hypothetical protein